VTFKRWDVISVPFPFIEGYEAKRRPVLVVSTEDYHGIYQACFGAMITTARNMQDLWQDDIEIKDLPKAGLRQPCVIRLARLTTFEASGQVRKIGAIGAQERRTVSGLLKRWFGV
jgi:mRNA interferase MazF